ncbi:MAG: hypothetical protein F7B59_02255 [Desulfurococcales archaeon]|nr:hypothetical protein [Desulfurococcales archaeon]
MKKYILTTILAFSIIILTLGSFTGTSFAESSTSNGWGVFNVYTNSLAVYDYDGDGVPEVIVSPDKIIDVHAMFTGPYSGLQNLVVVGPYLVSYGASGVKVYQGEKLVYERSDVYSVSPDLTDSGILVGDRVFSVYGSWSINVPMNSPVLAFNGTSPVVVYRDFVSSNINIWDNGKVANLNINAEPVAAFVMGDKFLILSKTPENLLLINVRNLTSKGAETYGVSLPPNSSVVGFDVPSYSFMVYYDGMIYLVGMNGLVNMFTGSLLCRSGLNMYIATGNNIILFNGYLGSVTATYPLPPTSNPRLAACSDGVIAVAYGSKVAVYYPAAEPVISINVRRTAYVLTPVSYEVDARNADMLEVMVNGTVVKPKGEIVFNESGMYRMEAYASNKFVEAQTYADIAVLPRPLVIKLKFNQTPVLYKDLSVTIEAFDGLSGEEVNTSCNLSVPGIGEPIDTSSWKPVSFSVLPSSGTYTVSASCGDNTVYKETDASVALIVTPADTKLVVQHPYNGTVLLSVYDEMGNLVKGKIIVSYGNNTVEGDNPLTLSLLPGTHTAEVAFTPFEDYYKPLKVKVELVYQKGEAVNTTSPYLVFVEKIPVTSTKTITKQVPIRLVEKEKTVNYLVLTAAVVVTAIAAPVVYEYLRRKSVLSVVRDKMVKMFRGGKASESPEPPGEAVGESQGDRAVKEDAGGADKG